MQSTRNLQTPDAYTCKAKFYCRTPKGAKGSISDLLKMASWRLNRGQGTGQEDGREARNKSTRACLGLRAFRFLRAYTFYKLHGQALHLVWLLQRLLCNLGSVAQTLITITTRGMPNLQTGELQTNGLGFVGQGVSHGVVAWKALERLGA